jgi:hypothetical protein
MTRFEESLHKGRLSESAIVSWLRARGNGVITVYEIQHDAKMGPRFLASRSRAFVAPDVLCFGGEGSVLWCETKHKTVFSWHRKTQQWVTGVDLHHFRDYERVAGETGLPVWLAFLHVSSTPNSADWKYNCPPQCPTGLFVGEIGRLASQYNHKHENWGRHGMIYWSSQTLHRLAPAHEVMRYHQEVA